MQKYIISFLCLLSDNLISMLLTSVQIAEQNVHTSLFSCVHRFIAKCILSITEPILPVKGLVNISTINSSPCLQEKAIFLSEGPCKTIIIAHVWRIGDHHTNHIGISLIYLPNSNLQDGLWFAAKETDMNSTSPTTKRTSRTDMRRLQLSELLTILVNLLL